MSPLDQSLSPSNKCRKVFHWRKGTGAAMGVYMSTCACYGRSCGLSAKGGSRACALDPFPRSTFSQSHRLQYTRTPRCRYGSVLISMEDDDNKTRDRTTDITNSRVLANLNKEGLIAKIDSNFQHGKSNTSMFMSVLCEKQKVEKQSQQERNVVQWDTKRRRNP